MFQPGLQTHFVNGRLEAKYLDQIVSRVHWMRMDVQKADEKISQEIYLDIISRQRQPLITVWSGREVWWDNEHYEYQNERSINLGNVPAISGQEYRAGFDSFYQSVKMTNSIAYYGAAANFENRDLNWYKDGNPKTLPPDVRFTIHDYWTKLEPLASRLKKWRDIIGHERLYLISECGVRGLNEPEHAVWTQKKFDFWSTQENCLGMIFFQIFDDPISHDKMGLFDEKQQLKQKVFNAFPLVSENGDTKMDAVTKDPLLNWVAFDSLIMPSHAIIGRIEDGKPIPDPNAKAVDDKDGKMKRTVLSLQPDGRWEIRFEDAIGSYETPTERENKLIYISKGGDPVMTAIAMFGYEKDL